jgi:diadenylate cyclase
MDMIAYYANMALRYIQTIKIADIVDMAIIAYIIYRLLLLTRRSQSGQVLKGIILVLVAMGLS